jgi:hypothetical protein
LPDPIVQVQPPLEFIPPALNSVILRATQLLLPTWLRSKTAITDIQADNVEVLVDLYQQFQAGKIRFLMAFRHPSIDDPLCMAYLLSRIVPQVAIQQKIGLQKPIHSHFIYDRGIPLWAGKRQGWLYSRLGGTPIHRGKVDRIGLRSARNLFANGDLPFAAAPEGATNGHNEIVSPLEPGVAQLGFWCVEDLLKAGRCEQVFIVPIGIQYRYVEPPWKALEKLLSQLEADSGLEQAIPPTPLSKGGEKRQSSPLAPPFLRGELREESLYRRLYRLSEHLLSLMEEFYTRFYHQPTSLNESIYCSNRHFRIKIAFFSRVCDSTSGFTRQSITGGRAVFWYSTQGEFERSLSAGRTSRVGIIFIAKISKILKHFLL